VVRRPLALSLALFAIAIPVTLAACGGDDDETTTAASESETTTTEAEATGSASASGAGGTVKISETEFKLTPSDPTTKAGTVTFDISNDGSTVHNLEVEGNGVEEESDDFQAGQSGKLTVDLKPGTYEIYCAIDDHKGLGMEGELTVQ
jgi:plastocyanin